MPITISVPVETLVGLLPDASLEGTREVTLSGLAALSEAGPNDLSFLGNRRYAAEVATSKAGAILLPASFPGSPPAGQAWIRVKNPSMALAIICEQIERTLVVPPRPGIHPSAVVDPEAKVDPSAGIGPLCVVEAGAEIGAGVQLVASVYIGHRAKIGAQSKLHPHSAVYYDCVVGARCTLHAGVVVGSDGFGYESGPTGHKKVPQIGIAVLEDDVEIGANSTIDRARFAATRVGRGTKIDNLVQVGHNVTIGQHCFLCSQAGIAGSSKLGNYVVLGGQVGVTGHIELGDFTQAGGQAGVSKSWPAKSKLTGAPAEDFRTMRRIDALQRRLPELFARLQDLEKHLGIERAEEPAPPAEDV